MKNMFPSLFRKKNRPPVRDVAALASPLAAPAVHVVKTDSASRSHFGGDPGLPPGLPWPERNGKKLGFLARLSLSEVHRAYPVAWLPSSGALLFFYDMEQQPWGYDPKDRDLSESVFGEEPRHQIAGFPSPVQDDEMELQCQLVTNGLYCGDSTGSDDPRALALAPGASNWRLLFQIDSDDDLGVMWGDGGIIYYWVEEAAARAGEFANTWLILQCH